MLPRAEKVLLGGLTLLLVLCAFASMTWPFGWDQGIFAWAGDVVVRGGVPYRDAWEMRGPVVYYGFAAAQFLFGQHSWSIRILDAAGWLLAAWGCVRLTAHLATPRAAVYAALLLLLWVASGTYWNTAQPDGWIAMLTVAAATLVLRSKDGSGVRYLLAGTCIGLITLIKFPHAVLGAFLLVDMWTRPVRVPRRVALTGLTFVGWCLPIAAALLVLRANGALESFIEATIIYPGQVYADGLLSGFGGRVRGLIDSLLVGPVAVMVLPVLPVGIYAAWVRDRRSTVVLLTWLLTAAGVVFLQGRFFMYHWLLVVPPAAMFVGMGVALVRDEVTATAPAMRWLAIGMVVMLVGHAIARPTVEVGRWLAWSVGLIGTSQYEAGFGVPGDDLAAARYINERSDPGDGVVIFGWNTAILFLSERASPTRFGHSLPLMLGEGHPIQTRYRQEFLCELTQAPPRYVVEGPLAARLLQGEYGLDDFPEFAAVVSSSFEHVATFGTLRLHERTGPLQLDASGCPSPSPEPAESR